MLQLTEVERRFCEIGHECDVSLGILHDFSPSIQEYVENWVKSDFFKRKSKFPSFSPTESEKSSYSNPITSYDAPIAPSSKELEYEEKKSLRKIRKVKKEKFKDSVESSDLSIPFGMYD